MNIQTLVTDSFRIAKEHGWWHDKKDKEHYLTDDEVMASMPEKLCLMHSEISEALEEYRKLPEGIAPYTYPGENGKPEGILVELADCVIRIADLCGRMDLDLAHAIEIKQAYNESRPYRHGNKNC